MKPMNYIKSVNEMLYWQQPDRMARMQTLGIAINDAIANLLNELPFVASPRSYRIALPISQIIAAQTQRSSESRVEFREKSFIFDQLKEAGWNIQIDPVDHEIWYLSSAYTVAYSAGVRST